MIRVNDRALDEASQNAWPGQVIGRDQDSGDWIISLGGPSYVRAKTITNGKVTVGDFVTFTRNRGEGIGVIDAPPSG